MAAQPERFYEKIVVTPVPAGELTDDLDDDWGHDEVMHTGYILNGAPTMADAARRARRFSRQLGQLARAGAVLSEPVDGGWLRYTIPGRPGLRTRLAACFRRALAR